MAIPGNLLSANAESIETDTSAWEALANADSLARVSGGTTGSWCLRWRATLAGGSQIGVINPVAVTAGLEYWACASIFPPAAGAQSRIEIRWYTSGGTLVSTTLGPNISAPSGTWHQVGAVGTAPAGAATAKIVIRSVATADAQLWYTDRVFFGLTTPVSGTLLPWNAETVEVDTSGWTAVTNCALSISTSAYTHYQSLLVTSSAAGACLARTASSYAVTPSTEYVAYAHVTPGTAGLTQTIRIEWLDASSALISTSSADWAPATGGWTRCVVVGTAPAGAAFARVALAPHATASGQQWVYDRIALAPSSALMTAGNLLPYNTSDVEVDVSGWTVTSGTKARVSEQALSGFYSMKLTSTGGDLVATATTPTGAVQEGLNYQFAPCVYFPVAAVYQTRIEWLDSGGAVLRTRWQTWSPSSASWVVGRMGDLAPDGAVTARLSLIVPGATAGDVVYVDRVEWMLGGLTVRAVPAGGGGVAITVRGLTTGAPTDKWSLYRVVTGQPTQPVRGWAGDLLSQTIAGDVAVATDYEAPLGVAVQWRAIIRDTGGVSRASYTSDPLTLEADDTSVWLKDPGLPQKSVRLTVGTPMPTWTRDARQGVSTVRGRARPVVISDVRGSKTGDLTVITETAADRDALWWVLDSGSVLLLQWPPGWGEDDIYVSVGTVQAAPLVDYAAFQDRAFVLPLTEVDRPIGGVTGSADRTWQTVKSESATWADVLAGAESWLDVYTGG